jgi:hypothetical protein
MAARGMSISGEKNLGSRTLSPRRQGSLHLRKDNWGGVALSHRSGFLSESWPNHGQNGESDCQDSHVSPDDQNPERGPAGDDRKRRPAFMNADVSLAAKQSRIRELTLAMSTALCYGVALGLFPALLPLNLESNGFETSWSGLLGATPALAGMAIGPFSLRIVARIGARPAYFAGAMLSISTAACFLFSQAYPSGSCFAS